MSIVEIRIGKEPFHIKPGAVVGADLHELANIVPPQQLVVSRSAGMDVPVAPEDYVLIGGGERFAIGDGDPPLDDNPCLRNGVQFTLNGTKFNGEDALDHAKVTVAELKAMVPDSQASDGVFAELDGLADEPLQDGWRIVVQDKDKFITVPCGNVGDHGVPAFQTFDQQVASLREDYPQVDVLQGGPSRLLIIRGYELPPGWSEATVDLMFQIPPSFPAAALDMFWVSPHIRLQDGRQPEQAGTFEQHAGVNWQRFSWHYVGHTWLPTKDGLVSHLRFCRNRLSRLS